MRKGGGCMLTARKKCYPDNLSGYLFIAPQMILFLLFILFPVVEGIRLSLYEVTNTRKFWVGLENYQSVLNDPLFHKALLNTGILIAGITVLSVALGFLISAIIMHSSSRFVSFIRGAFYLPTVLSMMVLSLIWRWMLNPATGVLTYLMGRIGLPAVNLMGDVQYVLGLIIFMVWLLNVGQAIVMYTAAMAGVDESLYEAAKIDGAGKWQQVFHITRPMVASTTSYLVVINIISSMKIFVVIDMMTGGGPSYASTNLMYLLYIEAFRSFNLGRASAIGVIMFGIVMLCSAMQVRTMSKQ